VDIVTLATPANAPDLGTAIDEISRVLKPAACGLSRFLQTAENPQKMEYWV